MINSKMRPCVIQSRDTTLDAYGQLPDTYSPYKTVDVSITLYSQTKNQADIRYKDATHIGLTLDKTLTDNMIIIDGSVTYLIQLVNNDGRYAQLILKEDI